MMKIPHVTHWLSVAVILVLLCAISFVLFLSSCVSTHTSWARAEVSQVPAAQQLELEKDRKICATEGVGKGIYYQAVMGEMDMIACLERRGWRRVP